MSEPIQQLGVAFTETGRRAAVASDAFNRLDTSNWGRHIRPKRGMNVCLRSSCPFMHTWDTPCPPRRLQ